MQVSSVVLLVFSAVCQIEFRDVVNETAPFKMPLEVGAAAVVQLDRLLEATTDKAERDKLMSHRAAANLDVAIQSENRADFAKATLSDLALIEGRYKNNPAFHELRANARLLADEPLDQVMGDLERAIQSFPEHGRLKLAQAFFLLQTYDFSRVEQICRKLVESEPENGEARILLGCALFHLNDSLNAVTECRRGLQYSERRECKAERAHAVISLSLLETGDLGGALAFARLGHGEREAKFDEKWFPIWACYANSEKPFSALAQCQLAMNEDATFGPALALRAISETNCSRPELALKFAEAGFKESPDSFLTCWALGRACAATGLYARAVKAFAFAEESEDKSRFTRQMWDCQLRLALLLSSADEPTARDGKLAIRLCQTLENQALKPENQRLAAFVRACAFAEVGEFESALQVAQAAGKQVVEHDPVNLKTLELLFAAKRQNRISSKDEGAIRLPDCGFISGQLKPLK